MSNPHPVAIADVDGDGANDIVVLHDFVDSGPFAPPASVGWFRQTAPGVFAAEETLPIDDFTANHDSRALAVGDLEGDGAPDILVATDVGISIVVRNSGVLPSLGAAWIVDALPRSLATNVAPGVDPSLTLGRDATNVDGTTVQLRDAAGSAVAANVAYTVGTRSSRSRRSLRCRTASTPSTSRG